MSDNLTPFCETAEGCPLGDLAEDPVINRLAFSFLQYRSTFEITKAPYVYEVMIKEFGLEDAPDLLFRLEELWQRWKPQGKE